MRLSDFSFTPSNYCCLLSTGSNFLRFKPSFYYSAYTFHCVLDTTFKQIGIIRLSRHEKYIDQSLTALFGQCYFCSEMLTNRTLPVYFPRFGGKVRLNLGKEGVYHQLSTMSINFNESRLLTVLHLQIYIWLDYNLILLPNLFFPRHAVHLVSESYFHSLFCAQNTQFFFLSCARLFKNMFWITYCELFLL